MSKMSKSLKSVGFNVTRLKFLLHFVEKEAPLSFIAIKKHKILIEPIRKTLLSSFKALNRRSQIAFRFVNFF